MTEKIDLRRKHVAGEYPPEITQLIAKYNGVIGNAERAAHAYLGHFGKIRAGLKPYTELTKRRVLAALNNDGENMPPNQHSLIIPDKCPPLLADLIRLKGSKAQAWRVLGTSEGTFYKIITGRGEMPPEWIVRAKAALGVPVIGAPVEHSPEPNAPQAPPFVPWDGKAKGTFQTRAHGKSKARTIKNVPQPLLDLMAKYNGVVQRASAAVGTTGNTLFKWIEGEIQFDETRQRKVHAATHGMPASNDFSLGEQFDKYTLGLAICLLKGGNFDRIADIADILNGRLVFRKNTSGGWLLVYKMATEDLLKFKKLALRDANEIVCP